MVSGVLLVISYHVLFISPRHMYQAMIDVHRILHIKVVKDSAMISGIILTQLYVLCDSTPIVLEPLQRRVQ